MQLSILYDFWKKKVADINDNTTTDEEKNIKEKLLLSQEAYFNEYAGNFEERIFSCYFNDINNLTRLILIPDVRRKGQRNFFDGCFQILPETLENERELDKYKEFLCKLLVHLRKLINKEFNKASIKRGK